MYVAGQPQVVFTQHPPQAQLAVAGHAAATTTRCGYLHTPQPVAFAHAPMAAQPMIFQAPAGAPQQVIAVRVQAAPQAYGTQVVLVPTAIQQTQQQWNPFNAPGAIRVGDGGLRGREGDAGESGEQAEAGGLSEESRRHIADWVGGLGVDAPPPRPPSVVGAGTPRPLTSNQLQLLAIQLRGNANASKELRDTHPPIQGGIDRPREGMPPDAFVANQKFSDVSYVPDDAVEIQQCYQLQMAGFAAEAPPAPTCGRLNPAHVARLAGGEEMLRALTDRARTGANFNFVPSGLGYTRDVVSVEEESALLAFIDGRPWDTCLQRRVQQYGFRFDHRSSTLLPADAPIPEPILRHCRRLVDRGLIDAVPNQLIINEYLPGQGIAPHVDQHCFEDTIAVISLGSAATMTWINHNDHLAKQCGFGLNEALLMRVDPRSCYVMRSMARWRWNHALRPAARDFDVGGAVVPRRRRVSLTFRVVDPTKWQRHMYLLRVGANSYEDELTRNKELAKHHWRRGKGGTNAKGKEGDAGPPSRNSRRR